MGIKVSVIIPMYNVSRLLEPCINTLYSQSYRNLELIFVNDCSKDDSLDKLKTLIASRNNSGIETIIVKHDINRGVAAARNTGLDHASGDYIYYVDADDYIEEDTIASMVKEAETHKCDIVSCEWAMTFKNNSRHMKQPDASNGEELFTKMAYGVCRWNLWLFLVRRSLYLDNNIRFIEGVNMGEDMMVMLKIALCANKVSVIHRPLYHYVQTNANAISKDIKPYIGQIKDNVSEVEQYIVGRYGNKYDSILQQLKLSLKLPLLISSDTSSYKQWLEWWPETNEKTDGNPELSFRTRMLQKAAAKKFFWLLKLYYWCVIKVIYGILFK